MPPSCDTVSEADVANTKMADPKIIDLIKAREGERQGPFTSLEFFPPRTDEGVKVSFVLVHRLELFVFAVLSTPDCPCFGVHRRFLCVYLFSSSVKGTPFNPNVLSLAPPFFFSSTFLTLQ
jgi:hypothetical protein